MNSAWFLTFASAWFLLAYFVYGRWLSRKVFRLDDKRTTPACEIDDGKDYVPTDAKVVMGHHFTSIAGAGPIVGPAIAVIWGWMPAAVWIIVGSVVAGAVHDFGAMVLSLRYEGRNIGSIAGNVVSPGARSVFLLIIVFLLWLVIAVFALVIGILFKMFPASVLPTWSVMFVAVAFGLAYRKTGRLALTGSVATLVFIGLILLGTRVPLSMPNLFGVDSLIWWAILLFSYCYVASILPVQWLLQPRDYINSHVLYLVMVLLAVAIFNAAPDINVPVYVKKPAGAPPLFPVLFITVACGAISGFHSLVSSGTSSKQLQKESSSQLVGYGSMLLEGLLALLVIVACTAGIEMGIVGKDGEILQGMAAFSHHYADWNSASGLGAKVGAFIDGSGNLLAGIGLPLAFAKTIVAVTVVAFAATTLDTATRLQRYALNELGQDFRIKPLTGIHLPTFLAVASAAALCFSQGGAKGGMVLWPVFGTTNQLLALLGLAVLSVYLYRIKKAVWYTLVPAIAMTGIVTSAIVMNLIQFVQSGRWFLFSVQIVLLLLEAALLFEVVRFWLKERKALVSSR